MKYCYPCKTSYAEDAKKYCEVCGVKLSPYPSCWKCGEEVDQFADFCSYCGVDLKSSKDEKDYDRE